MRARGLRLGIAGWIALGWLAALLLAAVFADALPLADPTDTRVGPPLAGPSLHHWLGTDQVGRDLLARIVYGARVSLLVGAVATAVATIVGGAAGIAAGYVRGRVETVIVFVADMLISFPALLLALGLAAFTQARGVVPVSGAVALAAVGPATRIMRAFTLPLCERDFILASRSFGGTHRHVVLWSLLPCLWPIALTIAVVTMAAAVVTEGALAYLNLSVAPPRPTWGGMIASGRPHLDASLYPTLVPAAAVFVTVLALVVLTDQLDPRLVAERARGSVL